MPRSWTKRQEPVLSFKRNDIVRRNIIEEIVEHWHRKKNLLQVSIQVDSASPVSFLKKNIIYQLKLRDPYSKVLPVDQATKELYCGFTDDAIKKIQKIDFPIRSNGCAYEDALYFCIWGPRTQYTTKLQFPKGGHRGHTDEPSLFEV